MMNDIPLELATDDIMVAGQVDQPETTVAHIAFRLHEQRGRILANWTLRVATLPAFRAMPDLAREEVDGIVPDVLLSALTAISSSYPTVDPRSLDRANDLAKDHGRSRYLDGFSAGEVLAEFNALEGEVWSAFWRVLGSEEQSLQLLREFSERLLETFSTIEVAAVESWVQTAMTGSAS
jgi:hypothetical protein